MSVPIRDSDLLFAAGKKIELAAEKAMLHDYTASSRLMDEAREVLNALSEWWTQRETGEVVDD